MLSLIACALSLAVAIYYCAEAEKVKREFNEFTEMSAHAQNELLDDILQLKKENKKLRSAKER